MKSRYQQGFWPMGADFEQKGGELGVDCGG